MSGAEAGNCENCCWCLSHCCLIYGVFGSVLMAWFSYLIATDSLTFQIAAMKHGNGWVKSEKVQACYVGAILYAVTFVVAYLSRSLISKKRANRYSTL